MLNNSTLKQTVLVGFVVCVLAAACSSNDGRGEQPSASDTTVAETTTTSDAPSTSVDDTTTDDAEHGHSEDTHTHDEPVATYPTVPLLDQCRDVFGHIHPDLFGVHVGDEPAGECHVHTCETPHHSTDITYSGEPYPCTEAPTTTVAAPATTTPTPTTTTAVYTQLEPDTVVEPASEPTPEPDPEPVAEPVAEPVVDPVIITPGYPDVYSLTDNPDGYYYRTDDPDWHAPLDRGDVCAGIDWPGAPTLTDGDHVPAIGTPIYEDVCWLDNQRYCRSLNPDHGLSELYNPCPYDVPNTRVDDCPSTPTADAELNVTRWPVPFRDFPTLNALNLEAGTYRAVLCFRYNNPQTGIPGFSGGWAVWFYPTGEATNAAYQNDRYLIFPVALLSEVHADDETTLVVPRSGAWSFRPYGLVNATWRLSLWKTA